MTALPTDLLHPWICWTYQALDNFNVRYWDFNKKFVTVRLIVCRVGWNSVIQLTIAQLHQQLLATAKFPRKHISTFISTLAEMTVVNSDPFMAYFVAQFVAFFTFLKRVSTVRRPFKMQWLHFQRDPKWIHTYVTKCTIDIS